MAILIPKNGLTLAVSVLSLGNEAALLIRALHQIGYCYTARATNSRTVPRPELERARTHANTVRQNWDKLTERIFSCGNLDTFESDLSQLDFASLTSSFKLMLSDLLPMARVVLNAAFALAAEMPDEQNISNERQSLSRLNTALAEREKLFNELERTQL